MFPESRGFVPIYKGYKLHQRYMFQFIPIKLVMGDEIVRPCDRHSNEIVTIRKHVTKYKHMQKMYGRISQKIWESWQ